MTESIRRYPSVAALARDASATRAYRLVDGEALAWFGNETPDTSIARGLAGDAALVQDAEALLSRIDAEIETPERPMIADVAGAYPCVPDFLLGRPDCMRRRAIVDDDASPVSIYVLLTSSADVKAATLLRRGVAILALTLAMQRVRPIALHVVNVARRGDNESVIAATINTAPLDIATAAYALTSAGFVRRLCYGLAKQHHFGARNVGLNWPLGYGTAEYLPALLRRLGGDPARDLIIPGAHIGDAMLSDPVAWVNAQIARFRGEGE